MDYFTSTQSNLTKRELFAAMAMQGIIANSEMFRQAGSSPPNIAEHAVRCADALLAELAKEPQG